MDVAMSLPLHPSLKKLQKVCREWLEDAKASGREERNIAELSAYLEAAGALDGRAGHRLHRLCHYYGIAACDAYFRSSTLELPQYLQWAIDFGQLEYRWRGTVNVMFPDVDNFPLPLSESNRAAGPCMLSQWDAATACAYFLIQIVHKDQVFHSVPQERRFSHGTIDAFFVQLFSQAFGIQTDFQSATPMIGAYQTLLDSWRTRDRSQFQTAMQSAAEYHISRSKDGTDRTTYEFEWDLDRVFPPELLAVQALRRRDGLPEFETGHLLVDAPWAIVRDLPPVEPHPLALAVEARLKQDYPLFR